MRQNSMRLGVESLEQRDNPSGGSFWDDTYVGAFLSGGAQGALNVVNGVQDAVIAIPNLVPAIYNNTAGNLGGGTIGYIPSPDWSKDLIYVGEPTHELSKFVGGQGAFTLLTMGASQIGGAGELVHLTSQEAAASIQAQGVIRGSGGIYAATNPASSQTVRTLTTLVADTSAGVPITGTAAAQFRPLVVAGPLSAYERVAAGAQFAPYAQITLATGETVALGFWARYPVLIDFAAMQLAQDVSQLSSGTINPLGVQ